MKNKIISYLNKKRSNALFSMLFKKYIDCLANGFSEEESYNQAISITVN